MAIKIIQVKSGREKSEFLNFPRKLHKASKDWEGPKIGIDIDLFDANYNPYLIKSVIKLFIAQTNGKTVGRIAVIVDQNYINQKKEAVGLISFFDCFDEQLVASALFNTASNWLREQKMVRMAGPIFPSPDIQNGLLIDGFDFDPYHTTAWNPPYYAKLYETSNFLKTADYQTWSSFEQQKDEPLIPVSNDNTSLRFLSYSKYGNSKPLPDNIWETVNSVQSSQKEQRNLNPDELRYYKRSFNRFNKLLQVSIAMNETKPVGVAIISSYLLPAHMESKNYIFPLNRVKFFMSNVKRKIGRLQLFQMDKSHSEFNFRRALLAEVINSSRNNKITVQEISDIRDDDVELQNLLQKADFQKYKTHRIFQRSLW